MNVDVSAILELVGKINRKKDELQAVIETSEIIQDHVNVVKEAQEDLKAVIAADEEAFALTEEIKALNKELGEAAKHASKELKLQGVESKPAEVKKFFVTKAKDSEAVEKIIQQGSKFNVFKEVL